MRFFRRRETEPIEPNTSDVELLVFVCPEVKATATMLEAATAACERLQVPFRILDVWLAPEAILHHRLMIAPALIVLSNGVETARLDGPRSRKQVDRFLAASMAMPKTSLPAPASSPSVVLAA